MKTVVINTSKEAKNTKLDVLFKAPFDQNSLLWIESELHALGETADLIRQSLIDDTDTVDRDYQLIVLVDLYALPRGNERQAVEIYQMLIEKYIRFSLVEMLYSGLNLAPRGVAMYFVDSSKRVRGLDMDSLVDNIKVQEAQVASANVQKEARLAGTGCDQEGNLSDEPVATQKFSRKRNESERILMEIFAWTEETKSSDFSWKMKTSLAGDESIDFTEIFKDTSSSIAKSHVTADVLTIALQEVLAPLEDSRFSGVGKFPVYKLVCLVKRDNEQSKIEDFFCVFANIFSCIQENRLIPELIRFEKDQIKMLLLSALKKYQYFSREENIYVKFEPVAKIFELRKTICERRKKEARNQSEFKNMSDEQVAELVMSENGPMREKAPERKLRGLDRTFHGIAEDIFDNYDPDVIRAQNNRIVKSCLEGLWGWRDEQTSEFFKKIVSDALKEANRMPGSEENELKRDTIAFIEEEYEACRDELINEVTDAEHKLASNKNILLETKDLVLQYGDWMRKGKWYWISLIGAIFTVAATIFPFFYTEYLAGTSEDSFRINMLLIIGFCAFLYALAASVYIVYINRKKITLIDQLRTLHEKSQEERKASIIALYHYYNDTVVDSESHYLLWREILRRDRENAKKGIKRNYHIKRLKNMIEQVNRFITMLKIDTSNTAAIDHKVLESFKKEKLQLNGEESYYTEENQRVYSFLPDNFVSTEPGKKGGTEEA